MSLFIDYSASEVAKQDILWLISVGLFQGFLALSLLIVAVKNLKAVEYGTISYTEPLVAAIIGYLLYSESLVFLQIFGCAIILFAGIAQVLTSHNLAAKA